SAINTGWMARLGRSLAGLTSDRLARILSIPLFLLLWQGISTSGWVNSLLFPPPTQVAVALYQWVLEATFWMDLGMSISRVVIGFLAGAAAGIGIGVLTGRFQTLDSLLSPVFSLLRPIPPI